MQNNFTPSVNIALRPIDLTDYFITSNVQAVFDAITTNFRSGIRSINLIGAYGTGKSSFLSAFEQHVTGNQVFFEQPKQLPLNFQIIKIVGEYGSFIECLGNQLGLKNAQPGTVLKTLQQLAKDQGPLLLMVDEFGKLLEYSAKHEPEKELFFIQQLGEFINNGPYPILWISTLHQDFSGYAQELTRIQRNEWIKVKGRFKEITFNEPVEQLLYLASERINGRVPAAVKMRFDRMLKAIAAAHIYPLRDFFTPQIIEKLFPLDALSAAILSLALQQYGQNERSLFSFLNGGSYFDLRDFDNSREPFYATGQVYDFLNYNLNSFLLSKANPHYSKWAEIRNALERTEVEFGAELQALYQRVVKTIGLFQIFLPGGARIEKEFLATYIAQGGPQDEAQKAISDLEQRFIIRYYKRMHRYALHEVSDVDIDKAIDDAAAEVSRSNDVVKYLNSYFTFPTISAKRSYFEYGTPRVFQFKITDNPYLSSLPEGEIDGFVNLIFNPALEVADLLRISQDTDEAILYGWYCDADDIRLRIDEIEKAEIAREKYKDDRIARREFDSLIDLNKNLLNHVVLHSFYNQNVVRWFYNGRELLDLRNNRELNALLSDICEEVYPSQPKFRSEIVNKSKLSPAASIARKELLKGLIEQPQENELGIEGFPPQKSIYYSLLREPGFHRLIAGNWLFAEPNLQEADPYRFAPLIEISNRFIQTSVGAKRSVLEFYEELSKRPFKLKRGFLDLWIPMFLLMKRDDFALYGENGFITDIDTEVLELLVKRPQEYFVKGFDGEGIKAELFNEYRTLLSLGPVATSNAAFIQTIVPYLKFYKGLQPYTKQTKRISRHSQRVRKALTDATDPEALFFEDLPAALGFDMVQLAKEPEQMKKFGVALQESIRELRSAFDELLNRFEGTINTLWNEPFEFKTYKDHLRARYEHTLKKYLLLPYQRTFYDRICSPLEQRNAWLSSVSQAVTGKSLENLTDEEEEQLFDRFLALVHELDNLNEVAVKNIDLEQENVMRLEITVPGKKTAPRLIRTAKEKDVKTSELEARIAELISGEQPFAKIAILAEMLRKELDQNGE